jgi:hypothetical protein
MRRLFVFFISIIMLSLFFSGQIVVAKEFIVGGSPLELFGYISQSAQISMQDDQYDTEEDLQQALMNVFMEADYRPKSNLMFYLSGMLTVDWIYQIKDDDSSWENKLFDGSKAELNVDDEYWQLLKEAHVTWAPSNFLFRVGKQIVSWGEMDFFRIMDQINPLDNRRGFSDIEFESTVIPTWLLRGEWWPKSHIKGVEEIGLQLVYNPNADFIPDQNSTTGNDAGGIWSAAYEYENFFYPLNEYVPGAFGTPILYVGALDETIKEPDKWEDGELGIKISMMVKGNLLTLNGFYGRENSPVTLNTGYKTDPVLNPTLEPILGLPIPLLEAAEDGNTIYFPTYAGYYPRQKYVGATWSCDLPFRSSALGGITPILRVEALYQVDKTFKDSLESMYYESDYLNTGIGIDWKIKVPLINPSAGIGVSPQFFYSRIIDYPDGFELYDLPDKDYYVTTLYLNTQYMNAKLVPEFAWAWDHNNDAHMILPSLTYHHNTRWTYSVDAGFFQGDKRNKSMWLFRNKDYISVKVKYNWG